MSAVDGELFAFMADENNIIVLRNKARDEEHKFPMQNSERACSVIVVRFR